MIRVDPWSTEQEFDQAAATRSNKAMQPDSHQISSDALAWFIITVLCCIVAVLVIVVHDMGVQINQLHQLLTK